ncbi:hypothetical protein E3N88_18768 [Mikania micrantha]|uniref:Uncharacterized protein n=1 Tax=Mikania micrantha TaxID=192012 RepID=A0A5N6NLF2_9ASTR|nr:hypothetical protein E3N88_18768 [Mikania micrantha]
MKLKPERRSAAFYLQRLSWLTSGGLQLQVLLNDKRPPTAANLVESAPSTTKLAHMSFAKFLAKSTANLTKVKEKLGFLSVSYH